MESLTLKALVLIGAFLLMSLVMAKEEPEDAEEKKGGESVVEPSSTTTKAKGAESNGIMKVGDKVLFLLPLMLMMTHLFHVY